jgi:hypothetical protein
MPPKLNADWHLTNRMPKNATLEQRVAWHVGHAANCECRPMPASIRAVLGGTPSASKVRRPNRGIEAVSKTYKTTFLRDGSMSAIPVPFDPKAVFGKVRAPVKVTINGYTYRSTIAAMGGPPFVPFRKSHREAAGLDGAGTVTVRLDLDTEKREVTPPTDLVKALKVVPGATERWRALSFTHQREHVEAIEGAKKPETRARRIAAAVEMVNRPVKTGKGSV